MEKLTYQKPKVNKLIAALLAPLAIFFLTGYLKVDADPSLNAKSASYQAAFAQLEHDYDSKLGVYALNIGTNEAVVYHADDRFPYCSTSKALAVGAVLRQDSLEALKQVITYTQKDILAYAPITKEHVDHGMTIAEICDAALRFSDNTAANLLFAHLGGPAGFKSALRQLGDNVTNPVRIEPDLNVPIPGETMDTSTPRQLATDLQAYAYGNLLTDAKKKLLIQWMTDNVTGGKLIRAGAPQGWVVADKSGSGAYGTRNNIAMVMPPNKKPIMIAILSTHDQKEAAYDDKLIAQAAKIVFDYFTESEKW